LVPDASYDGHNFSNHFLATVCGVRNHRQFRVAECGSRPNSGKASVVGGTGAHDEDK
jgi:hypothetical protein